MGELKCLRSYQVLSALNITWLLIFLAGIPILGHIPQRGALILVPCGQACQVGGGLFTHLLACYIGQGKLNTALSQSLFEMAVKNSQGSLLFRAVMIAH